MQSVLRYSIFLAALGLIGMGLLRVKVCLLKGVDWISFLLEAEFTYANCFFVDINI